jgi:hypothetical protein
MRKSNKLSVFITFRAPADYPDMLEQARRALGARSIGEVMRIAAGRLLKEVGERNGGNTNW